MKNKTKGSLQERIFVFVLISFFMRMPLVAAETELIPLGQTVGVALDMEGVTVVDTTDVEDYDGNRYTPAKDAGIRAGDRIKSINGIALESAKQLDTLVGKAEDTPLEIVIIRNGKERVVTGTPALSKTDGKYRLGVWVKDAASGIGTITYVNPETLEFGALGHGICDTTHNQIIEICGGDILNATVVSVQKGSKGCPGELLGVFSEGKEKIGEICENSTVGLKGTMTAEYFSEISAQKMPIAKREDVYEGEAEILANIEENKVERFSIRIKKINRDTQNEKGLILEVTDPRLLEKTGGIVQGMSGSPIVQEGKLVGAVTHVFVNDPTMGYGILIETMLQS